MPIWQGNRKQPHRQSSLPLECTCQCTVPYTGWPRSVQLWNTTTTVLFWGQSEHATLVADIKKAVCAVWGRPDTLLFSTASPVTHHLSCVHKLDMKSRDSFKTKISDLFFEGGSLIPVGWNLFRTSKTACFTHTLAVLVTSTNFFDVTGELPK